MKLWRINLKASRAECAKVPFEMPIHDQVACNDFHLDSDHASEIAGLKCDGRHVTLGRLGSEMMGAANKQWEGKIALQAGKGVS